MTKQVSRWQANDGTLYETEATEQDLKIFLLNVMEGSNQGNVRGEQGELVVTQIAVNNLVQQAAYHKVVAF